MANGEMSSENAFPAASTVCVSGINSRGSSNKGSRVYQNFPVRQKED